MSIERSIWYEPLGPGTGRAKSIGWWGMLLGAAALLTFHASLVGGYLYLSWREPVWPPAGIAPPAITPALASLAVLAAAAVGSATLRLARRAGPRSLLGGVVLATVLAGLALTLRVRTYLALDLRWDEHAYGSLFWLLGGYEIVILAIGVLVGVTVVAEILRGLIDVDHDANAAVAVVYWWFAAVTSLLSAGTLHLVPYV